MPRKLEVEKVVRKRSAHRLVAGSADAFRDAIGYTPLPSGAVVVLSESVRLDAKRAVKVDGGRARAWPVSISGWDRVAHLATTGKHAGRSAYMLISDRDLFDSVAPQDELEVA